MTSRSRIMTMAVLTMTIGTTALARPAAAAPMSACTDAQVEEMINSFYEFIMENCPNGGAVFTGRCFDFGGGDTIWVGEASCLAT